MKIVIETCDGCSVEQTDVDLGDAHADLESAVQRSSALDAAIREHLWNKGANFTLHPNQESHPGWYQLVINVGPVSEDVDD